MNLPSHGKLLGLDIGQRRIGVAISDPGQSIASGWLTIDLKKKPDPAGEILKLLEERNCVGIVCGYPLLPDGRKGSQTVHVEEILNALQQLTNIPVKLEDECHSSQVAKDLLKNRPRKRKKNRKFDKGEIDRLAACLILQDYLEYKGKS